MSSLHLCWKDSSEKHCASSMQISLSNLQALSRKIDGRRTCFAGKLENLLPHQPPTPRLRFHLFRPPFLKVIIFLHSPRTILQPAPPWSRKLENILPHHPPTSRPRPHLFRPPLLKV